MKIIVAGATGFLGRALVPALKARGHHVVSLVRGAPKATDELSWNPDFSVPVDAFEGADAVINLCGETLAGKRWTTARRQQLLHSRLEPTDAVVAALHRPPGSVRILLNASATGYYGDTQEFQASEASPPGPGFLARLCVEWEASACRVEALGVRLVRLRFGVILGPGGAMAKMLPFFRLGLGGRLASGQQWMSWISREDAVRAVIWCLEGEARGPVNVCSPHPVRNHEFTRALAKAVRRPVGPPVPAIVLSTIYGQLAREALLISSRVRPEALTLGGFGYRHPQLQEALNEALATN